MYPLSLVGNGSVKKRYRGHEDTRNRIAARSFLRGLSNYWKAGEWSEIIQNDAVVTYEN
jgi:hypothetical protein